MEILKQIWIYNDDFTLLENRILKDGEKLPDNATFMAPKGYGPFKYDPNNDSWIGVSETEYNQTHPIPDPIPSDNDVMMSNVFKVSLKNATDIDEIKKQLAKGKVAVTFSSTTIPVFGLDVFSKLKSWFEMKLIDETVLEMSVVQGVISKREKDQILE